MIKSVTIQEFDEEVLKVGSFITYCNTYKRYTDEFRNDFQFVNGKAVNGIISHVGKNYINIVNIGKSDKITIDNIVNNEKRILGILENVIEVEPTEPIVDPSEEPIVDVPEDNTPPVVDDGNSETTPNETSTQEPIVNEGETQDTP